MIFFWNIREYLFKTTFNYEPKCIIANKYIDVEIIKQKT